MSTTITKTSFIASGLVALTLGVGCGGVEPADFEDGIVTTQNIGFEQWRLGLPTRTDGVPMVEWDIALPTEAIQRAYYAENIQKGALTVYNSAYNGTGTDRIWSASNQRQLTYCISSTEFSSSEYSDMVSMMKSAANAWEKGADVNFIHDSSQDANCDESNSNVVFDVRPAPSGETYFGSAFFPNYGRSNRTLFFNFDANWDIHEDKSMTGTLRHELGHALGFRHEQIHVNQTCNSETSGYARQLTAYDDASVMHYPYSCALSSNPNWSYSLTSLDKSGAESLYGAPRDVTFTKTLTNNNLKQVGEIQVDGDSTVDIKLKVTTNLWLFSTKVKLFVRWDNDPTTSTYDCKKSTSGSTTCSLTIPASASRAHIAVQAKNLVIPTGIKITTDVE